MVPGQIERMVLGSRVCVVPGSPYFGLTVGSWIAGSWDTGSLWAGEETRWEVSLMSAHCRHLGAHGEVLCHSLLGHVGGPTLVMTGKQLPAWVWGHVQGQSGC